MKKLTDQDKFMILAFGAPGIMMTLCIVAGADIGYVIGSILQRQIGFFTYFLAALGTICAYIWARTTIALVRLSRSDLGGRT